MLLVLCVVSPCLRCIECQSDKSLTILIPNIQNPDVIHCFILSSWNDAVSMILREDAKDCPDVSRDTALVIWALGLGGGDEECRLCGGVGRAQGSQ